MKSPDLRPGFVLRERDSNARPSGYEPDELPLLHPAMSIVLVSRSREQCASRSMRAKEQRDPSIDAARSLALRRLRMRIRIALHRDERFPRPHPPQLFRLLDDVVRRFLFSRRGLQLRAIRLFVRDVRCESGDGAIERVL